MGKQIWKKMFLFVFIISIGLTMSGCWDYQEINNVTNVAGIALDKGEEKKFKLTFETIVFKPSADFNISVKLVETEGDTIFEGIRNAVAVAGKRLYIGHCKAIIFSEEIAKEGIKEHLDFFVRDHELRMTLLVFVAKGVEARETLKDTALIHQIASYELERLVRNDEKYSSLSNHKLLFEVMREILDEGISLTLPVVEIKQIEENKTFTMEGIFYFENDKLAGFIEPEEIKFYLILKGKLKGGIINVPLEDNPNQFIVYEIQGCQTDFEFKTGNNPLLITKVSIKTSIGSNPVILSRQFSVQDYQRMLETWLNQELVRFFAKIKNQVKCDVCGFEKRFFQKYYQEWLKLSEDNKDFFEILEFQVKVKSEVNHTGTVKP